MKDTNSTLKWKHIVLQHCKETLLFAEHCCAAGQTERADTTEMSYLCTYAPCRLPLTGGWRQEEARSASRVQTTVSFLPFFHLPHSDLKTQDQNKQESSRESMSKHIQKSFPPPQTRCSLLLVGKTWEKASTANKAYLTQGWLCRSTLAFSYCPEAWCSVCSASTRKIMDFWKKPAF